MRFAFLSLSALALALLGGCSDPVPPTPMGGWTVQFSSDAGQNCGITPHTAKIGDVSDKVKVLVTDGSNETDIACTVSGKGSFNVDATVSDGVDLLNIIVDGIAPGATADKPVPGAVTFSSLQTSGQAFSSGACSFYFTPGAGQTVAAGTIWVTFDCPAIVLGGEGKTCKIAQGVMAVDRCDQ